MRLFLSLGTVLTASFLLLSVPQTTSAQSNCDAAYPGVCIPSPPPDLDCRDITHRNFTVLDPDPHNFDGDGYWIGCERR